MPRLNRRLFQTLAWMVAGLTLSLSACGPHAPAPQRPLTAPRFLLICEAPRMLPLPPPPPRSAAALFDWAKRLQAVSMINAENLAVCQGRILRLDAWWRGGFTAGVVENAQ